MKSDDYTCFSVQADMFDRQLLVVGGSDPGGWMGTLYIGGGRLLVPIVF